MISIIVAVAENGVIGDKNSLLWHISEDLRNFKRITSGHPVIMGRKTFESLGRPLPNRQNVVISRTTTQIAKACCMVHNMYIRKFLLRVDWDTSTITNWDMCLAMWIFMKVQPVHWSMLTMTGVSCN